MYTTQNHTGAMAFLGALAAIIITLGSAFFVKLYDPEPRSVTAQQQQANTNIDLKLQTPVVTLASQDSSDGSHEVTIRHIESADEASYEIYTKTNEASSEAFFRETLPYGATVNIPFNSWSPDNKYFFITELRGNTPRVLVFQAGGQEFAEGKIYLDLTEDFRAFDQTVLFDQATGWANPQFIIINSKNEDGTRGPSFWYQVSSRSIIPLGIRY